MRIVADFGGTNARIAGVETDDRLGPVRIFAAAGFAGLEEAIDAFLSEQSTSQRSGSHELALAIAGPTQGEALKLTNLPWSFSRSGLRERFDIARLVILNDFEALALGIPALGESEVEVVRPGTAAPGAPVAVIGPGTGLGVAALVRADGRSSVVVGEGGHVALAATNEAEWRVVERLTARFGRVSAERILSGPGLENLHAALVEIEGGVAGRSAAEIAVDSRRGDARAVRATRMFSAWLGAVAGDLALTLGARGGVYLGGGVLGGLGEAFDRDLFRERFTAKGRLRDFVDPIPVRRILRGDTALLGCAVALATAQLRS